MRRAALALFFLVCMVAAAVGLAGDPFPFSRSSGDGLSAAAADSTYLRLDTSNDPLTGELMAAPGTAAATASITTASAGGDLWISAGDGAGGRALFIDDTSSTSATNAVMLRGSAAATASGTSILLDTTVSSQADRYPVRITGTGSADVWKVNGLGQALSNDGSQTSPSLSFAADTDTGIFRSSADVFAAATGGSIRAYWSSVTNNNYVPVSGIAGAASGPSFTTTSDLDTGLYFPAANSVAVAAGSSARMTWTSGVTTSAGEIQGPGGAATAPTYSFTADPNSGVYSSGADQVSIGVGGAESMRWNGGAGDITAYGQLLVQGGTAGSAGLAFATGPDGNTGLYRPAADQLAVTAGGVQMAQFYQASAGEAYLALGTVAGSSATPSIHVVGDTNTGVGWYGADLMGISVGGSQVMSFDTAGAHLPNYTTGTATLLLQLPTATGTTVPTKPTCNSGRMGHMLYLDDTNDAAGAEVCICGTNSAGTYGWYQLDVIPLGTACGL